MEKGFDVLIVSTQNSSQEEFWQKKLRLLAGAICRKDALIVTIAKSWKGDPGTGLGFLHAYALAQEKAKFKYHKDLFQMQKAGASVALYLADYLEKELFPLIACENSSIASLKLPPYHNGQTRTLLETVIKQTNQRFSEKREGRLSVFFTHQLFFPSTAFVYSPNQHIDLYCQQIFREQASRDDSESKAVESVHAQTPAMPDRSRKNLHSFSLSKDLAFALISEFQHELSNQENSLDCDADFLAPLTLNYTTFLSFKPTPEHQMRYHRMRDFFKGCEKKLPPLPLLKTVDIASTGYYWNFGSCFSFHESLLKLTKPVPEGYFMRRFFETDRSVDQLFKNRVITDRNSCLLDCSIQGGIIKNSVLLGVEANSIEAENCVIINSRFSSLISSHSLLYHVKEAKPLKLAHKTARADIFLSDESCPYRIYSQIDRDIFLDWDRVLPQNPLSFYAIHKMIQNMAV